MQHVRNPFRAIDAQSSIPVTKPSSVPSKRAPFAIWVISVGLVFSGLDLLYGISPDLSKLSSSSDPLLFLMILFVVLCFVGAAGAGIQKTWGYILGILVSLGFIIGANGLDAWIPTLMNPHDFNTFIVADTIVPILVLVAIFSILGVINRKKNLNQKKYLTSGKSLSGALTAVILVLAIVGAIAGAALRTASEATTSASVSVTIVSGAYNPSNTQHFLPATI
ncbi:MAG TPA: hypothetical protein VED17_03675, partial [Nitrososphaerales archaeon]|nr:hypothetical protein [Nitrososphaerales archaeon]